LNGLSAAKFVSFWKDCFEASALNEKACQRKIAHFLDEPIAVVSTVFTVTAPLIPYKLDYDGKKVKDATIHYCVACLKEGFHASFHEDYWLKKCLIHNIPLTFGGFAKSGCGTFEGRVSRLKELHAAANPRWPVTQVKRAINPGNFSVVVKYLQWRKEAEHIFCGLMEEALEYSSDNHRADHDQRMYRYRDLDLLLGRLAWSVPMPDKITDFLVVTPSTSQQPQIQNYGEEAADELSRLLKIDSLSTFLWVYRLANLIKDDFRPYQQIVKTAITELSKHQCHCEWGLLHGYWTRFLPGVMSDYPAECPYEVAAEKLRTCWLELFPGFARDLSEWSSYWRTVEKYRIGGVVSVTGCKVDERRLLIPWLEFQVTDQVVCLLENILERLAQIQVEELAHWLETIDGRDRMPEPDSFPPNLYIDHNKKGELLLVSWPTGERRSFEM
jgi:hypothetical protein